MTNPEIGMLQLGLFIFVILLGFPIAFTLMAMAIGFGLYAMGPRIFDLLVTNTADVMQNDVLTAVPLFLFMGYVVERANILDRLFHSIQMAAKNVPGSLLSRRSSPARYSLPQPALSAPSSLDGPVAFPAMLRAGYDTNWGWRGLRRRLFGIMIRQRAPHSLWATTATSVVKLYAAAFIPGFLLASLYIAMWSRGH